MSNNAENAGVDESTSVRQEAEQHADQPELAQPESAQQAQNTTPTATTTTNSRRDGTANSGEVPAASGQKGKRQADKPCLPDLSFNPKYPNDWNGLDRLVRPFNDVVERDAVMRIFQRLGPLKILQSQDWGDHSNEIASNTDVALGLIRRLLHAQIYFTGEDFGSKNKQKVSGYATGAELLDPSKNTFNEEFFSVLFSGIMAETRVQVSHYVYTILFCKKLMSTMASGSGTAARPVLDPDFSVSLFSLNDVIKNIYEESKNQFDTQSSSAYGWLNIWLLGVQKILICRKVPSDQHLVMFRNAVAHNQFDMDLNYIQLFNKAKRRTEDADSVPRPINWMGRIVHGDLFEVNMVLMMLHNSGYILNVSQDQLTMDRCKGTTRQPSQAMLRASTQLSRPPSRKTGIGPSGDRR